MPLLHRLATLRDDVIFFVYLYQAWAYRVDHSRVNEFGQVGGEEESDGRVVDVTDGGEGKVKAELGGKAEGAVSSAKEKAGGRKRKV